MHCHYKNPLSQYKSTYSSILTVPHDGNGPFAPKGNAFQQAHNPSRTGEGWTKEQVMVKPKSFMLPLCKPYQNIFMTIFRLGSLWRSSCSPSHDGPELKVD